MVEAVPATVENAGRLVADKVRVGSEVETVALTSRYFGVAPLPVWLIAPVVRPGGAVLATRTMIACERVPLAAGLSVVSPTKLTPSVLISKYCGARTVMPSVNSEPVSV